MYATIDRCNAGMEDDNLAFVEEWPKPKKSKTEESTALAAPSSTRRHGRRQHRQKASVDDATDPTTVTDSKWGSLPTVIVDGVFKYLSFGEVITASSVCRNWRLGLFHPRYWQHVTFVIEPQTIAQVQFYRSMAGHLLTAATIRFNSMYKTCVAELLLLLEYFKCNNNLQSLVLEPSHCHVVTTESMLKKFSLHPFEKSFLEVVSRRPMSKLTIGCNEELLRYVSQILEMLGQLKPEKVTTLGLATLKDDPIHYELWSCNPSLFEPFINLQILSLDYDIMSDALLESLHAASKLERLVVHIHGISEDHPGTSEGAWRRFRYHNPLCRLRLSLIHAFEEVNYLHTDILRDNMPLSHLKVLFCEAMNLLALESLIKYRDTFCSLVWVDSLKNPTVNSFSLVNEMSFVDGPREPMNFILISWLCKKLEEIVVLGYKYFEEDWIGVSKLRGNTLKTLQIADSDVISSGYDKNEFRWTISKILGSKWAPLQKFDLHPVLEDPEQGDSDEYLMPLILADLQ